MFMSELCQGELRNLDGAHPRQTWDCEPTVRWNLRESRNLDSYIKFTNFYELAKESCSLKARQANERFQQQSSYEQPLQQAWPGHTTQGGFPGDGSSRLPQLTSVPRRPGFAQVSQWGGRLRKTSPRQTPASSANHTAGIFPQIG